MSQQTSESSSRILQRSSSTEPCSRGDGLSGNSLNINGKRSLHDFQEDQFNAPRKLARLDCDDQREREKSQQPSDPGTTTSNPNLERGFVAGPGHIIFINERGKLCPAICFNGLFLSTFNDTIVSRRAVEEKDGAIQMAKSELERIRSSNESASTEKAKRLVEEALKSQEAIEAGIPGLVEARRQYEALKRERDWYKLRLDNSKELTQLRIEEMLNNENLLNKTSSKSQEPVEATKDSLGNSGTVAEKTMEHIPSSDSGSEDRQSPINVKEQITPRQLALRELRFAAEELHYYKDELTFMQEEYPQAVAVERRSRREQYPNRPASATQTDIDLQTLQKTQHATRKVIEAEEGYDRAEAHAEALGLGDILADPHACYYGEVYNDFQERTEKSLAMSAASRVRIEAWMAAVPDVAVVGPLPPVRDGAVEVDDWDAKSVEVFESVSLVAYDVYRKKIDRWQELGGRLREGES